MNHHPSFETSTTTSKKEAEVVVKWLAEVAHDRKVVGSIPATTIIFQMNLPLYTLFVVSTLRKRIDEKINLPVLLKHD